MRCVARQICICIHDDAPVAAPFASIPSQQSLSLIKTNAVTVGAQRKPRSVPTNTQGRYPPALFAGASSGGSIRTARRPGDRATGRRGCGGGEGPGRDPPVVGIRRGGRPRERRCVAPDDGKPLLPDLCAAHHRHDADPAGPLATGGSRWSGFFM